MLKKNEQLELLVERFGLDAVGVCHAGGLVVFVPGALPGEKVLAQIVKVEKRHAFAKLLQVLAPSPDRQEPPCPAYGKCGGCSCQHMTYGASLAYKRSQVADCLGRIGGMDVEVEAVRGAQNPWGYRNKASFPIGGEAGLPQIGFYALRSHRIIDLPEGCPLQRPGADAALRVCRRWMQAHHVPPYDERTHTGLLRHLVTRVSTDGWQLVVLVANGDSLPRAQELIAPLRAALPGLVGVVLNVQKKPTNVILGAESHVLWGAGEMEDTLHGLGFRVSPHTFFQVNPDQTEVLYNLALEEAGLTGIETVVDAYCGAGTLSLMLAGRAKRVIGLEIVPQAIEDARENARKNGIGNAEFILGAAEEQMPRLVDGGIRPQVVLLDPPRKGCEPGMLEAVSRARPRRIVYVSCNPATLARDGALLMAQGYRPRRAVPVDMFCWTGAVECVMSFEASNQCPH